MDEFTAQHLSNWWDVHRFEDEADQYPAFVAFVSDDLDYWGDHGWTAAWSAFQNVVAS